MRDIADVNHGSERQTHVSCISRCRKDARERLIVKYAIRIIFQSLTSLNPKSVNGISLNMHMAKPVV